MNTRATSDLDIQRILDRSGLSDFLLQTARFYLAKLVPETATLRRPARTGSKVLMDTDAALA